MTLKEFNNIAQAEFSNFTENSEIEITLNGERLDPSDIWVNTGWKSVDIRTTIEGIR